VLALKQKVAAIKGYDVAGVKLIFSGKILKDEDTLATSAVKTKEDGGFIVVMASKPKVRARAPFPSRARLSR
jgi:UV excision repair protein RAD23